MIAGAAETLRHAPGRAALTILGVAIGVAAVVCLVSLGEGALQSTADDIAAMGLNVITVQPGSRLLSGARISTGVNTLTPEDAEAVAREVPGAAFVSPSVRASVRAVSGNQNVSTTLRGGSSDFPAIRRWVVERGAFFDAEQVRRGATVCVLGRTVADALLGGSDPVGARIRVNRVPFVVVGVLERRGQTSTGQDEDDVVVVPWTTGMRRVLGTTWLGAISVSARDAASIPETARDIGTLLRRRHRLLPGEEDDFTVRTPEDIAQARGQTTAVMTTLVVVVALIALVVGGVGVMNVMLVGVLERTREIGLRMAVGARQRDIAAQFVAEAVLLTALGGVFGVAGGAAAAALFPRLLDWPVRVTLAPAAGALMFSGMVGLVFGLYPAIRASRLDPIEALRAR